MKTKQLARQDILTNRDVIFFSNFLLDLTTAFQSGSTHHEVQDKIPAVCCAKFGIRKLSAVDHDDL